MALGSAVWGVIATHVGISETLLGAAGALIVGLGAAYFFPLRAGEQLDLEPSLHWPDPVYINEPHPLDGPVLVTIEYRIDPADADDFVSAMREVKRILQRTVRYAGDYLLTQRNQPSISRLSWGSRGLNTCDSMRVTMEDRIVQNRAGRLMLGPADRWLPI